MKRFAFVLIFTFLQILGCKENAVNKKIESEFDQNTGGLYDLSIGDTLIIGSFENGQPILYIPDSIFENSFQLFCDTNGYTNAQFVLCEISDIEPFDTNFYAYLSLRGIYTDSNGINRTISLAIELEKNVSVSEYIIAGGGGETHQCAGLYCSSCPFSRNLFRKIIGCEPCAQRSNEDQEGQCIHTATTTEGGNGLEWGTLLIGILALFL